MAQTKADTSHTPSVATASVAASAAASKSGQPSSLSQLSPLKVCVFGLWHLGSVTAACLADMGLIVSGLDFNEKVVADLRKGEPPLYEPDLAELVKKNIAAGRLSFHTKPADALLAADYLWVAFDTPVDENDVADLDFVEKNLLKIVDSIPHGMKIIISSQAPAGFVRRIEKLFAEKQPSKAFYFACSPENLRLGAAIRAFREPARIIIGVRDYAHIDFFSPLFSKITSNLEWMKIESAEMTKHAINSFLAVSIAFTNEIALICEAVGANAKEVERGLKTEPRIGQKAYVGPGLAFAGGTLARDINYLVDHSDVHGKKSVLLRAIRASNDHHKHWIREKCASLYPKLRGVTFGILGLAYKPNTNTLRRSSSVELCEWLHANGAIIHAYDPHVDSLPSHLASQITLHKNAAAMLPLVDCIVVATEHPQFRELYAANKKLFTRKTLIDPTGMFEKDVADVRYASVGRITS